MAELIVERRSAPYPRRTVGRPSKYNEALAKLICAKLANGTTRCAAAQASGVNIETLGTWIDTYPEFSAMVMQAEAEAEIKFTQTLMDASTGDGGMTRDWRAAETWLKRRRRADYGDTLDIRKVDAETLLQLLKLQQGENQTTTLSLEAGDEVL